MKKLLILALTLVSAQSFACGGKETLCKHDRVQFTSNGYNYVGTAKEVFNNGKVKINSDSHSSWVYRETSEVGKGLNCFNRICEGDRVQFTSNGYNYVGTAKEVFNNGKVKINSDSHPSWVYRETSDIGKGFRCVESLCKGDRVQFKSNGYDYTGTVIEAFDNGKTKINSDSHSPWVYRTQEQLGYEIACSISGSKSSCVCTE